jgi:hypothetical protein
VAEAIRSVVGGTVHYIGEGYDTWACTDSRNRV